MAILIYFIFLIILDLGSVAFASMDYELAGSLLIPNKVAQFQIFEKSM
jgi:hypothetical protein